MTWFAAGAAALTVATTAYSGMSAKNSAIKNGNQQSAAEGQAIVKERLNKTISNSYSTAFSQMQLAMKKRQLAQQGADISAASLSAHGDADAANAATGSIGATTRSVASDITGKSNAALAATQASYDNAVTNYNNDLDMMVLNTDQSSPNIRENRYDGPSTGQILGGALVQGAVQFASGYASRKMTLGAGNSPKTSPLYAQSFVTTSD